MKKTIYAVIAASLAMLATSGIVALATAAPQSPPIVAEDPELDAWLSAQIDKLYREAMARSQE